MSETTRPPAVKKRPRPVAAEKVGSIKLPVQVTLEPDARWHSGVRQLMPDDLNDHFIAANRLVERTVLPARERQNAVTLSTAPGLRDRLTPDAEPQLYSTLHLLAHNNAWYRANIPDTLRAVAAHELIVDLGALHTKPDVRRAASAPTADKPGIRFVHPDLGSFSANTTNLVAALEERSLQPRTLVPPALPALPAKAADRAKALADRDRQLRMAAFFEDDPLGDEGPDSEPYGMAPAQYRILNHLRENMGERFERRHELQRDFGENIPRRSVEVIQRARLEELRFPANGYWRGCRRGALCIVHYMAARCGRPDFGYTEREYISLEKERAYVQRREAGIAVSDEADGPAGLCVDDIIYACTSHYSQVMACKRAPREGVNPFSLADGVYARDYLIPDGDGLITGIDGNMPQFLANTRQFTRRKQDGRDVNYLEDVGSLFRPSLSEANTCLGAPKARPFAGPFRFAATPLTVFLPRRHLERAASPAPAWVAFLRECHPAVLADRAALASTEDDQDGASRAASIESDMHMTHSLLPVVWLRQSLLLSPSSMRTILREMTPQAVAMSMRLCHYDQRVSEDTLLQVLELWADLAFCSFERCVSLWLQETRRDRLVLTVAPLVLLLGAPCHRRLTRVFWSNIVDHGRGLYVPPSVRAALASAPNDVPGTWRAVANAIMGSSATGDTHVFWAVAVFRCAVAAYFTAASYRRDVDAADLFDKTASYFISTHVDLLVHVTQTEASDRILLEQAPLKAPAVAQPVQTLRAPLPWLALFYPAANRVNCAEELPDFAPALAYANPWYDMGNKKTQMTLFFMLVLLFLIKVMNSTCQRRGYMDILVRNIRAFPVIGQLLRLIIRCVLVGNLPGALSRMPLGARVRVHASFAPFASAETDADFMRWVQEKRMTVWFLVREYYFFHVSNAVVLERTFADSRKWSRFKVIVRIANAEVRRDLAAQLGASAGPVSWEGIEHTAHDYRDRKGKDHYRIDGRIMDRHDRSLKQFTKLKKGRFEEVFKRKTKGLEKLLHVDYAAADAWLRADDRLKYCHLVAWYLAQLSHDAATSLKRQLVIEMRWFKALGMSDEGVSDVRAMIFEYYEWDTGDEGMKKKARRLYERNPRDYVITRVVSRLVELYRDQTVYILPHEQALRQTHALRASMGIEPMWSTLPSLGRHWYCEGCHQWASSVQPRDLVLAGDLKPTLEAYTKLRARVSDSATAHATLYGERVTLAATRAATRAQVAALAFGSNANEAAVSSFRRVYMDPFDGKLYCRRGQFREVAQSSESDAAVPAVPDEDAPADADDEEDPFDELALGRLDPKQWLKAHGKSAAEVQGAAGTAAPLPPKSKPVDDVTTLAVRDFSCNRPLTEVCLMGANWRLHGRVEGLCVFCGRPCEVLNCNKTGLGLSCGKHPLADAYPDNHRLWLSLQTTRAEVLQAFAPPPLHRPCFACRSGTAVRFLESYDFQHRLFLVPLCMYHFLCCSTLIPVAPRLNAPGGSAVVPPPLRIDHIMERVWANQ